MIQFDQSIADAYVSPSRNVALPSTPGRQVKFLQGHAVIKDGRDLVAMMKRPEVKIILTTYALSWLETFLAQAGGQLRAELMWPDPVPPPVTAARPDPAWDPAYRPDGPDSPKPDS